MFTLDYFKTLKTLYTKTILNKVSSKSSGYQKFLIIGFPRSGTTLLHTYLNSHPNILSYGEINVEKQSLQALFTPQAHQLKAIGAKILLPVDHNARFEAALQSQLTKSDSTLKIIFLERQNLLKWYLSLKIAEKTQQWSQTKKKEEVPVALKQVVLEPKILLNSLEKVLEVSAHYQSLTKEFSTISIRYEELVNSPATSLQKTQSFLKVKPLRLFSLLQKQNQEPLSVLIKNYQEVVHSLQGTYFQNYLED